MFMIIISFQMLYPFRTYEFEHVDLVCGWVENWTETDNISQNIRIFYISEFDFENTLIHETNTLST